jgi:hypothetical protein
MAGNRFNSVLLGGTTTFARNTLVRYFFVCFMFFCLKKCVDVGQPTFTFLAVIQEPYSSLYRFCFFLPKIFH